MKPKPILAIDLGSSKVACVVGHPQTRGMSGAMGTTHESEFDIVGCGLASYPLTTGGWPSDSTVMARTLEQALVNTKVGQLPSHALVALTHPALVHRRVVAQIDVADEPATIRSRELQRLNAQAVGQTLGIDRDAVLVEALAYAGNGFQGVKDPRGLLATRLHGTFQLVSIPFAIRRTVTQALDAVGLEAQRVCYSLPAIAAACAGKQLWSTRLLIIDIGGCCTDLAIIDQGSLAHSLTIPWGGLSIVEALAKECRLTMEEALPLSLEGLASQKPKVRQLVEQQLRHLRAPLHELLKDQPLPTRAIVTGRGALIDGVVEWVETMSGINAVLGRSPRAKHLGNLSQQVALTCALGLLEHACAQPIEGAPRSFRLVDRLLDRTKRILVDYF